MANKYDGVIEAVRYKNGQIVVVRAFERRGAAFSDRVMMDRRELLERLKDGRKFIVGKRKELLAGSFEFELYAKPIGGGIRIHRLPPTFMPTIAA